MVAHLHYGASVAAADRISNSSGKFHGGKLHSFGRAAQSGTLSRLFDKRSALRVQCVSAGPGASVWNCESWGRLFRLRLQPQFAEPVSQSCFCGSLWTGGAVPCGPSLHHSIQRSHAVQQQAAHQGLCLLVLFSHQYFYVGQWIWLSCCGSLSGLHLDRNDGDGKFDVFFFPSRLLFSALFKVLYLVVLLSCKVCCR